MFQVSVVNRTLTISDLELHRVVRAINRQIAEDFAPYRGCGGRLRAGLFCRQQGGAGRPAAGRGLVVDGEASLSSCFVSIEE